MKTVKKALEPWFLNAIYSNLLSSATSRAHYYHITGEIPIQIGGEINEVWFAVVKTCCPFQHVWSSRGCATKRHGSSVNHESQSKP